MLGRAALDPTYAIILRAGAATVGAVETATGPRTSMKLLIAWLVWAGLVLGLAVTLSGFLAPLYPPLEMPNHFRPWVVLGCILIALLQLAGRSGRAWPWIAVMTGLNVALLAAPVSLEARPADTASRERLKLVSLNVWANNRRIEDVAQWVRASGADVVALQELPQRNADKLLPLLRDVYPYQAACGRCRNLALLSRRPLTGIEEHAVGEGRPGLLVARLPRRDGGAVTLVALHTAYPFRPFDQARHYAWLGDWLKHQQGPLVALGDFNLTPWAWKMWRLQRATGLVRHGTWHLSWSGHLPLQTFLIDNVLTTPDIRSVSFTTGPEVGSDHLPIVATLALP